MLFINSPEIVVRSPVDVDDEISSQGLTQVCLYLVLQCFGDAFHLGKLTQLI